MNLDLIEIHNAVIEPATAGGGWSLPRYPAAVRAALNPRARWISAESIGAELRFVCGGPEFQITLGNPGPDTEVTVRRGSFWHSKLHLGAGQTRTFLVSRPAGWAQVNPAILRHGGWSPEVWRIQFDNTTAVLHDINPLGAGLRPPAAGEKPSRRWLAYGSSITHADLEGYPLVAAQLLGVDVLNKGMSGSCHIEREAVDWFSSLDFDFATLELGINMRGPLDPQIFEERAGYLLARLRQTHPQTPLVLITHFLNRDHHLVGEPSREALHQAAFDDILRRFHAQAADPHLHLIEGRELLTDFHLLAADLIHPTHEGQNQMAHNLAARLRSIPGIL